MPIRDIPDLERRIRHLEMEADQRRHKFVVPERAVNATLPTKSVVAGGGVTDHGQLSGLGDDDHAQYLNNTRGDARYIQLGALNLPTLPDPNIDKLIYWNDAASSLDWYVDDGWNKISTSGTYVATNSFRVSGDVTPLLQVGTKIKFTNSTIKYAYVSNATYSSSYTTITIIGSTLVNTSVSNLYYSYADSPYGFPSSFSWTPSTTGWSGTPAIAFEYTISSRILFFQAYIRGSGLGSGTATTFTVPIGCKNVTNLHYGGTLGYTQDSEITSTPGRWVLPPGGSIVTLYKDSATSVFSMTSGTKAIRVQGFYHI